MSHQSKNRKRKNSILKFLFVFYIILGLLLISISLSVKIKKQSVLFNIDFLPETNTTSDNNLPAQLIISDLAMTVDITEGLIRNGKWDISNKYAIHLSNSKSPGDGGNIVIYAHNRKRLFGPLTSNIQKGQTIRLVNKNNEVSQYIVKDVLTVNANYTEIVKATDYEVLTLFTCTGVMDSKRLVIRAFPSDLTGI